MKFRYQAILVIFAFIMLTTTLLETGYTGGVCGTAESGCVIVKNSEYSSLFGVSNTYAGIFASFIIVILSVMQLRNPSKNVEKLIKLGVTVVALFAIYFIYLQFFVINAICPFCMVVDVLSLIALAVLWHPEKKK